jgi:acyl carrier protein
MNATEIAPKVEQFIEENFVFDPETVIARDQSLLETGVIDSTGILELVAFLEKSFEVTVEDEELTPDNLDSISKIAEFVAAKK